MKNSAVILSGGASKRFGIDKGIVKLLNKPLIMHVNDSIAPLVDEIIIVLHSKVQLIKYQEIAKSSRLIVDECELHAPIGGALTGFKHAHGEYSILLSCDTPLISRKIVSRLLDLAPDNDAVVPQWPNKYIEPLQAVYKTQTTFNAAVEAIKKRKLKLSNMIEELHKVIFISTKTLEILDPNLDTFFNVNTPLELEMVETIMKSQKSLY
ncbi:MAG: molybdenum cofactor guanylyltransferase [Thermoproteota archaeon]|nr:molybdenum cofactor guanylyltransferase [Thermoproteota archaeon]